MTQYLITAVMVELSVQYNLKMNSVIYLNNPRHRTALRSEVMGLLHRHNLMLLKNILAHSPSDTIH